MNNLTIYLDDLESRIDPSEENRLFEQWSDFCENRFDGEYFQPKRSCPNPSKLQWPSVTVNQTLDDCDKMIFQQLKLCSDALQNCSGSPMMVRANYGTSIIPLLFGVEAFLMSNELDCLPTSKPLRDTNVIRELVEKGMPDLTVGYGEKVFVFAEKMKQIRLKYPYIGKHIYIYHPDLQGPFDICEVVWGSEIFYALYDDVDLVKAFLEIVTETYIAFMKRWEKVMPFRNDINPHWCFFHKGQIMLRDDSAMNLSPDQFDEFIKPYDQRLLHEFSGGACHFCGKGDHYIERMCNMDGVYAIAMGQPQCNDMEKIYQHTIDKGIKLLGLEMSAIEEALKNNRPLKGQVHSR